MKLVVLAEHPVLLRHLDFVRDHFTAANLEIEPRQVHARLPCRFRCRRSHVRVAIFDNAVRASDARLKVLRALWKSKQRVLILVRGSIKDMYMSGWVFPPHCIAYAFQTEPSRAQRDSFLARVSAWPEGPIKRK